MFLNFVHLSEKGVSQFEAKGRLFSSLKKLFFIFYFTKSRRDLQNWKIGVTRRGESDFRWIIFSKFWKNSIVENSQNPKNKKSENPKIQKFEKSKIRQSENPEK